MNRLAFPAAGLALGALPFLGVGDYYLDLLSRMLIAGILAGALNLVVGYGGLMSLCHNAFLGLAAYGVSWLVVTQGYGHVAAVGVALSVTVLVAAVFGILALRASGISFFMITLALGQIAWGIAYRWVGVTGGETGIRGLERPAPLGLDLGSSTSFYLITLVFFCAVFVALGIFVRSPFGASLRGTRDQPRRMNALGFDVLLIRWATFVFSGFIAGVAGVLFAYLHKYINPQPLSLVESAQTLLMVIIGGSATLAGPLVGAVTVLLFANIVSIWTDRWVSMLGLVFLLVVVFLPEGLAPGLTRWWRSWRPEKKMAADEAAGPPANDAKQ